MKAKRKAPKRKAPKRKRASGLSNLFRLEGGGAVLLSEIRAIQPGNDWGVLGHWVYLRGKDRFHIPGLEKPGSTVPDMAEGRRLLDAWMHFMNSPQGQRLMNMRPK
jgi:hypothetical protein